MKKWIMRVPRMLDGMKSPSFGSGAGLMIAIAFAIFIAYQNASVAGLIAYGAFFALGGYNTFIELLKAIISTQGIWMFSLFFTIVLILFTILYLVRIEKRPLVTAGISRGHVAPRYALGFALGAVMLLLCFFPSLLAQDMQYKGGSALIPVYLLAFVIQSASEEIFFRGFLMTAVAKRKGVLFAVLISSALFSAAHITNGGYSLLAGLYYMLIGAFLALLMLRTNSLWASCGFHGAWNFTIGLLAPMEMVTGLAPLDYALFDTNGTTELSYGIIGDPYYLIFIGVFLIAVALLLFAGKNRLMVRVPRSVAVPPSEPSIH